MLASKLRLHRDWTHRLLANRSIYNWGNYDASSGECCPVRDSANAACTKSKWVCSQQPVSYKCFDKPSFARDRYPMYLKEIYQRGKTDANCQLSIRHDKFYKPSDKSRRYQRTWPECPLIWLRPKDVCCPDPECCPPEKRRVRKPPKPPLSAVDKHLFQMSLLCRSVLTAPGCRLGRRPPKCVRLREPSDCCKTPAPMPSFSEVCRHLVPFHCPQECACLSVRNICDAWTKNQKHKKPLRICTKPLIGHRPRMLFPF